MAWTKEETREVIWCYMYCKQYFTANYKKMYEIRGQGNLECRKYMDAKKLMNQKNYIMKNKKITEVEIKETHQQNTVICKLKEKIESTYYQVTQIEIDKRPRLQKL
jgi:hypothetical protein